MVVAVFPLTYRLLQTILKRARMKLADGKRALYHDYGSVLRCYQCKEKIPIGANIVSKSFGCQYRVHYCVPCAKTLHIIR